MNKFKYYFLSALICGFSFSVVSCGDDDDDEKIVNGDSQNTNNNDNNNNNASDSDSNASENMKGGDIVGSWSFNGNLSKADLKGGEVLQTLMGDMFDLKEVAEQMSSVSESLVFNADGTFEMSGDVEEGVTKGTYKTVGNALEIEGKDADGEAYIMKAGHKMNVAELMGEMDEDEDLSQGIDMKELATAINGEIKSVNYSVEKNQLTINSVTTVTVDLTKVTFMGAPAYDVIKALNPDVKPQETMTMTVSNVFDAVK